ncbi:MFS transporter [Paenibacillus agricola]|uniref:MFS transporter n=1 Tax=Paenibacillus agricola TaxID=2716264 RepID=A0ABX0J943_9BACL|nr:MFS transporter [Paenibacillus agricola]NHN31318.1 MFS transporter [Paenibacillus agricola]
MLKIVILIAFGFHTMVNMTRPITTLYATGLGANTFDIGMLTATYAIVPLMLAIHAGRFADRMGDRLPVLLGTFGTMLGSIIPFLFPSLLSLYISQALIGISHVLVQISLQNVLGNSATRETRDHFFSMFSMVVASGSFIGPIAGGYLADHFSYSHAFFAASFVGLLPAVVAILIPIIKQKKEKNIKEEGSSSLSLLKIPDLRRALATSALVLYSRDIFVAYFPLFASQAGISASSIGWIIAIQGLAMMAVRFFLGRLTVSLGRDRILMVSIITAGLSFLFIPIAGNIYVYTLLSACMGFGLGCGQPLSMTTTYNASPKSRTGEVLGLRLASNRLSQTVAPLFFGLVGSWAGILSVFYVSGAFLIGGAILTRSKEKEKENS